MKCFSLYNDDIITGINPEDFESILSNDIVETAELQELPIFQTKTEHSSYSLYFIKPTDKYEETNRILVAVDCINWALCPNNRVHIIDAGGKTGKMIISCAYDTKPLISREHRGMSLEINKAGKPAVIDCGRAQLILESLKH